MPNRPWILTVASFLLFAPPFSDGAEVLRDPTRPYSAQPLTPVRAAPFSVTAIFVSNERRVAVVNGKRVVEGDQIAGATVIEILADGLRLDLNGKVITARLASGGLRK